MTRWTTALAMSLIAAALLAVRLAGAADPSPTPNQLTDDENEGRLEAPL